MCLRALNPSAEEWRPSSATVTALQPQQCLLFYHPLTRNNQGIMHYYYYYYYYNQYQPLTNAVAATDKNEKVVVVPSRLKMKVKGSRMGSFSSSSSPSPRFNTTVMMRNIPNKLRRDFILAFLDRYCSEYGGLEYDFVYLPMDFRQKDNLGYAFINFTTPAAAKKFKTLLQNFRWETADTGAIRSKKVCEITWARIQGKERLVKRFQGSNFQCDEPDFLPVLLDPPRNGSDPEPAPPIVIGGINPM